MFGKALNILVSTGKPLSCFVSPWPCAAAEMYEANMQDEVKMLRKDGSVRNLSNLEPHHAGTVPLVLQMQTE